MPLKQIAPKQSRLRPLRVVAEAIAYRVPMAVTHVLQLPSDSYPICPRCRVSFDREYTQFCDRCGQRLAWELYRFATPVRAGEN